MWKFALLFAVVHGASCIDPSAYWVLETLKCSEHRVIVTPNKNLVETSEALDQMCKRQDEFSLCLEKLASLLDPASVSELSSEIASERSVFDGLCSRDSPWRKRYLEFAPCINMQQTDFCSTQEFLGADNLDRSPPCTLVQEKMENCIAATLSIKCGVEAGQLFHYLLKLKGDDVSQPVEVTCTHSESRFNGSHSKESVIGEIYDELVKKIGHIPEQDSESSLEFESFDLHKRVGEMHEELESVDETISSSSDIEILDPYLHFINAEDGSENVENAVSEDNSASGVISSTLDAVDETPDAEFPETPELFSYFQYYGHQMQKILRLRDELKARVALTLPSVIKDRFRSARTLNPEESYETVRIFPDGRINYYSRRMDIQKLETIKCYNFPDYFVCIYMPRSEYPRCLKTTDFTGPRDGQFFPEEFDPEFGAQWYQTVPKEGYLFETWVHKSEDAAEPLSYTSAVVTEDTQASYVPVDNGELEDGVEQLEDVDANTHIVSKDDLSFNIMKDSDVYEFTTKENKAETVMQLFKVFTTALPSTSKIEIKNLVPENVEEALANLYESKRVSFENVKIRFDSLGNLYIFWNNQQESAIDTITCGKVNECHPKGEGIWKCVIVPRQPIETDSLETSTADE